MATKSDDITLYGVLSETTRILKANKKHFFILYLLFLLPNYLSFVIYTGTTITSLQILYIVISIAFSISATGTIIYSAFHGYYNRPLELVPTLKSLLSSFIPLCSTLVVFQLISGLIGALAGILGGVLYMWLENFTLTIIVVVLIVCVCLIYLQVKWFISNVIVVVESKWGYEPLRRSAYLMNGMRRIAVKMIVLVVVPGFVFMYNISIKAETDEFWVRIFKLVVGSCGMSVLGEYNLVALVVVYVYCKKKHGELPMEIQAEEYVSLTIDENGNKSVAAIVHA